MEIGKEQAKAMARFLELAAERAGRIRLNMLYRSWSRGDTAFLQALDENGNELARMVVDEWLLDKVEYSGEWDLEEVE
jgi:hypothetical protein